MKEDNARQFVALARSWLYSDSSFRGVSPPTLREISLVCALLSVHCTHTIRRREVRAMAKKAPMPKSKPPTPIKKKGGY